MVKHIEVYGQVQCVGFRFYTLTMAEQLGIDGWVRNRIDGSVEIMASGDVGQMERFIEKVKDGPRFSRVDRMEIEDGDQEASFYSFRIK